MTMMKTVSSILFIATMFVQCETPTGVDLRIKNTSKTVFEDIRVNNVSFGSLSPGETSSYMPFENIYAQEYIEVITEGQSIKMIPEDYMDKPVYHEGKYRYDVDILHKKWLDIKLEQED